MSFEMLDQLETKIKAAVDTIQLLQLEIDDLKEKNHVLAKENEKLSMEQNDFQDKLKLLLGKIENI